MSEEVNNSQALAARTDALEVEISGIKSDVAEVRSGQDTLRRELGTEIGAVRQQMSTGFTELHRSIAGSNKINWSVVIGAGMLMIAVVGYLQVSFLKPLQVVDDEHARTLVRMEQRQWDDHTLLIRADERQKITAEPFLSIRK